MFSTEPACAILDLAMPGMNGLEPYKRIAAEFDISEKTMKSHRARVMRKTGARSIAELAHQYIEWRRLAD